MSARPRMVVGARLALRGLDEAYELELQEACTLPNPEYATYWKRVRDNPWLRAQGPPPEHDVFWARSASHLLVPRGLFEKILEDVPDIEIESAVAGPRPAEPLVYHGGFRPGQAEAVEAACSRHFCHIVGSTGSGKTNIGLQIAAALNYRTLWLTHTEALVDQAAERVRSFLKVEPGLIRGSKMDVRDFTVATIQTLNRRDLAPIEREFGLVVLDEAHHAPAFTFTKVLQGFYAVHVLGLTATPGWRSGRIGLVVGPCAHEIPKLMLQEEGSIMRAEIHMVESPWKPSRRYRDTDFTRRTNDVAANPARNDMLEGLIRRTHSGRISVALSDRVDQLEEFAERLEDLEPVLLHGRLKPAQKKEAYQAIKDGAALVLATYSIIGEGFDAPDWNQEYMLTPPGKQKAEQAIGRVVRSSPGKPTPLVWDVVDFDEPTYASNAEGRIKLYQKGLHADVVEEY